MIRGSELRIGRGATLEAPRVLRHALRAFVEALGFEDEACEDVLTAVGEALANAVEHAYATQPTGTVELHAYTAEDAALVVDVLDRGTYIERELRPGRGFGFRIMRAIARSVTVDTGEGTRIRLVFGTASPGQSLAI